MDNSEYFFRALSDNTRRQILENLAKKEMVVTEIVELFEISQPSISHHLSILKSAGLVCTKRDGKEIIYKLNLNIMKDCCLKYFKQFDIV